MTESKHTEGPWEVVTQDEFKRLVKRGAIKFKAIKACNEIIIQTYGENAEANARLIAKAPELLEACKNLVIAHDKRMGKTAVELRIELAKQAIAKAEPTK